MVLLVLETQWHLGGCGTGLTLILLIVLAVGMPVGSPIDMYQSGNQIIVDLLMRLLHPNLY